MAVNFNADRRVQYAAFQAAFKEFKAASEEFEARITALVESGRDTDVALDGLVLDISTKHRRWMDLSKPFVR